MIRKIFFALLLLLVFASSAHAAPYTADNYTKILLHFDGADTANTTTDDTGRVWTMINGAKLWQPEKLYGNASLRVASAGNQYMTTTNVSDLIPADNDFTLNFSMKLMTLNQTYMIIGDDPSTGIATVNSSFSLYTFTDQTLRFIMANGTTYIRTTSDPVLTDLNWHNYTIERQGHYIYMFKDGVKIGEGDVGGMVAYNSPVNWSIGRSGLYPGYYTNAYIDELEYSVGIARLYVAPPKYYAYGDSITYGAAYTLNTTGYDMYLNQMVRLHDPTAVAKRSVDGSAMTSSWGLAQWSNHYIPQTEILFLEFGVNDVATNVSVETTASNIITMYNWGQSNGTRVIPLIQTVMVDKNLGVYSRNLTVQQNFINTLQARLDAQGIYYIKMYDALDSVPTNGYPDMPIASYYNTSDGVHPTIEGHTLMAEKLWSGLSPVNASASFEISTPQNAKITIEESMRSTSVSSGRMSGMYDAVTSNITSGFGMLGILILVLGAVGVMRYFGFM